MSRISKSMDFLIQFSSLSSSFIKSVDGSLSLYGINFTELMVMHHLSNANNQTMRRIELANAIGLTPSGVTRLLNPMEKIHLVEKEKNNRDARVSLVKLTNSGHQLYKDALLSCTQCANRLTAKITANQLSNMLELITKLK